ncbi:LPS-assembly lipoprotein LptE [Halomonas sp. WWR20]
MNRRTFLLHSLGLASATFLLSGCGFHLRGLDASAPTPPALDLHADASPLRDVVRDTLENAEVRLDDQAAIRANLGEERILQQRLTANDTGSQERRLILRAPFSVQRVADGAYLLDQQWLEVSDTVLVSNDNLLARDELVEEATARLRQDAARELLNRLRALNDS